MVVDLVMAAEVTVVAQVMETKVADMAVAVVVDMMAIMKAETLGVTIMTLATMVANNSLVMVP